MLETQTQTGSRLLLLGRDEENRFFCVAESCFTKRIQILSQVALVSLGLLTWRTLVASNLLPHPIQLFS